MSDPLDQDIVQQLSASRRGFKSVYPVLYCLQHPDAILSGRHRAKAGWENRQPFDVEKWAKEWNVPHDAAHEIIRDRLSVQRTVSKEERAESLVKVARELTTSGTKGEVIVARVAEFFPHLNVDYIRNLLPAEFKDARRQDAGKKGREEQLNTASDGRSGQSPAHLEVGRNRLASDKYTHDEPFRSAREYSGRSKRMSESTLRADGPSENRLQDLIQSIRFEGRPLNVKFNSPIEYEEGRAYTPDSIISDWLILEVEGAGSASAENEQRDATLRGMGKRLLHLANGRIGDPYYQDLVAQCVRLSLELGPPKEKK